MNEYPHVLLMSADSALLGHWQRGLAGHARLHSLGHWMVPGSMAVTLIDLRLPGLPPLMNGEWHEHTGQSRLVACTPTPDDAEGLCALEAGFVGYCNAYLAVDLLPRMVQAVQDGEIWVGRALMQRLLRAAAGQHSLDALTHWRDTLTDREQGVAELVAQGASNKEVARTLGITERTVKDHMTHILDKLHVRDRVQLALRINGVDRPAASR